MCKVEKEGYHFVIRLEPRKNNRYTATCDETGDYKDSDVSFDFTIDLLLQSLIPEEERRKRQNQNPEYIKEVFSEWLMGEKLAKADRIVGDQVNEQEGRIDGEIFAEKDIMETAKGRHEKIFYTEYFKVTLVAEGWGKRINEIIVRGKEE